MPRLVDPQLQDVQYLLQLKVDLSRERNRRLVEFDRRVRALEVIALLELASRLIHGVHDFVHVEFGDDVEGGHYSSVARPSSSR